jgi:hypothetical protein
VRFLIQTLEGKRFTPLTVFEGKILAPGNQLVARDYGRRLEYWLFSTARLRRDQLLGAHLLPVVSFEQCRLLGQRVIETTPRQCLLPDNNLLLETPQPVTLAAAKLKDFDGCWKAGLALIYTFPRRCIAAGGRVFTEPPRVFEENWNKEQLAREARLSPDNLLLAVSPSLVSATMLATPTVATTPTVPTPPTKVSPTLVTSPSQVVSPLAVVGGSQPSRTVPAYNWMQLGGGN